MKRTLEIAYVAVALLLAVGPFVKQEHGDEPTPQAEVAQAARQFVFDYAARSADACDECIQRLESGEITTDKQYADFMEQANDIAFSSAIEPLAKLQNGAIGSDNEGKTTRFTVDRAIEFRKQVSSGLRSVKE